MNLHTKGPKMPTLLELRILKRNVLAAQVASAAAGSGTTMPAGKPMPFGATESQQLCAIGWEIVYLLDLIACLDIADSATRTICINSAYAEYCLNFDSCFPE